MAEQNEILLVEDYEPDARYLGHLFRRSHVSNTMKVVYDGREALDFLLCQGTYLGRVPVQRPKVILLDLRMPRMDGVSLLRQIKQDPHTRSIPVIILTGSIFEEDLQEARAAGAGVFLRKPVTFDAIHRACAEEGFELSFG
jgi:two-component system, response regulator